MRWALHDGTSRVAMLLGTVLAALLPSAFATGTTMSATVTLTVLALALAAVARVCTHGMVLATRVATVAPRNSDEAVLVLPGRATDTLHHPLRPRAPGLA